MQLTSELNDLSARYPTSKIIAISHSHGGNVVAWASTSVACSLTAAIYLNTPFIQVLAPSTAHRFVLRAFLWFGVTLLSFGGILVLEPTGVDWFRDLATGRHVLAPTGVARLGDSLGGLVAWSYIVIVVFATSQKIVPTWVHRLSVALTDISNARRKIFKELVVNATGDEAASMLGGIYIGQWLIKRAFKWLIFFEIVITAILIMAVIISEAIAGSEISKALRSFLPDKAEYIATFSSFIYVCIFALIAVFAVWVVLAAGAYGILHGLMTLDSPISVTPAPLGHVDAITIAWTHDPQLRHSMLHQSAQVGNSIVEWLEPIVGAVSDA
jgi:hypothetical protein